MSRRPGWAPRWAGGGALVLLAALWLTGCAAMDEAAEVRRLHARASYERGLAHLKDRQAALALSAFREAIALDDSVPVYHNALGVLLLELRRPDLALASFRKAVELDDTYAEAHLNVGIALAEAQRWEEAVTAYRRAIALPTLAVPHIAWQNLGLALYHLKRYREAEEALRFALSLEPKMAGAYYNLGLVLVAEDRTDAAKLAFRRVRELEPQSPFGQAALERLRDLGEGG